MFRRSWMKSSPAQSLYKHWKSLRFRADTPAPLHSTLWHSGWVYSSLLFCSRVLSCRLLFLLPHSPSAGGAPLWYVPTLTPQSVGGSLRKSFTEPILFNKRILVSGMIRLTNADGSLMGQVFSENKNYFSRNKVLNKIKEIFDIVSLLDPLIILIRIYINENIYLNLFIRQHVA